MRTIDRMPLTTLWNDEGELADYRINIDDGLTHVASDWGTHAGFQVVVLEAHH